MSPDIFVSKDLQQKRTDERIDRIKKLLKKENEPVEKIAPKSLKATKDSSKNTTASSSVRKKAKALVKKDSSKHVLAQIQAEIHQILKDKPQDGFLSSFLGRPQKLKFETQDKEEKVLALLRQHWVVNVPWLTMALLMTIAIPFIHSFILQIMPSGYTFVLTLAYFLVIFYFVTERLLKWFYNVYIVTDERILDVDFDSLLYKKISGTKIDKIQDISYKMSGLTEAFFNYGTVLLQTASEIPTLEFENVAKPQEVVSLLNQLLLEEEIEKIEGRVR